MDTAAQDPIDEDPADSAGFESAADSPGSFQEDAVPAVPTPDERTDAPQGIEDALKAVQDMDGLAALIAALPPESETSAKPEAVPPPKEEADPEEESSGKKLPQFRLRPGNELDALALKIQGRNPDLTLKECIARAEAQLAPSQPASPEPAPDVPKAPSDVPSTVAELKAAIRAAKLESYEAEKDLDYDRATELKVRILDLEDRFDDVRLAEESRAQAEESAFDDAFNASVDRATALYRDAGVPNSAFANRMREIDADLKATGNDLFYSPDKTLKIAQMVGNEMGIPPNRKTSASPAPAAKAPSPPPTAPGSARTSTFPAETQRKMEISRALDAIQTPEQLDELLASLPR